MPDDVETDLRDAPTRLEPPPSSAQPETLLGRTVGNHRLKALIGVGGMGAVYRAENEDLERRAAVKALRCRAAFGEDEALARFLREGRALARLDHPNVVRVYDIVRERNGAYLIMEFVDGCDLERRLARGRLSVKQTVRLLVHVARGLGAAHAVGIVHRDVKPANVLVSAKGQVKVSDFGLARPMAAPSVSRTGAVVGTPYYMSPEQAQGLPVDARADIYSLGAMAYALLSGDPPFGGTTPMQVLIQHCDPQVRPRPLRALNPKVPSALAAAIAKMMAQRPEDRYASMAEVEAALLAVLRPAAAPPRRRWRRWLAGGCAALLLLLLLARPPAATRDFAEVARFLTAHPEALEEGEVRLSAYLLRYPDSPHRAEAESCLTALRTHLEAERAVAGLKELQAEAEEADSVAAWDAVIAGIEAWRREFPDSRHGVHAVRGLRIAREARERLRR